MTNKEHTANILIGGFIGVSVGVYLTEPDLMSVCKTIGLASVFLYAGLIYAKGGRFTIGAALGAPFFMLANVITASLLLMPADQEKLVTLGALAFVLSLLPLWMAKRAIRAGKIRDGNIIN